MLLQGNRSHTILRNWILAMDSLPLKGQVEGSIDTVDSRIIRKGVRVAADAAPRLGGPSAEGHKGREDGPC